MKRNTTKSTKDNNIEGNGQGAPIQNAHNSISTDTSLNASEDAQQNTPLLDMSLGKTQRNTKGNMKGNMTDNGEDKKTEKNGEVAAWNISEDPQPNTPLLDISPGNTQGNTNRNMKGNIKMSTRDNRTKGNGQCASIKNAEDCIVIDTSWNDSEHPQQNTPLLDLSPEKTQGNTKGNMRGNVKKSTKDIKPKEKGKSVTILNVQECVQINASWNIAEVAPQNTPPDRMNFLNILRQNYVNSELLFLWRYMWRLVYLILFVFFILMIVYLVKFRLLEFSFIPEAVISRVNVFDGIKDLAGGNISKLACIKLFCRAQ